MGGSPNIEPAVTNRQGLAPPHGDRAALLPTINVALGEQFVDALRGDDRSVSAVAFHQQVGCAPDVDFFGHRGGLRHRAE